MCYTYNTNKTHVGKEVINMTTKSNVCGTTNLVLDEKAASKLATGIAEAKLSNLREIMAKASDIIKMPAEDVGKLSSIVESATANGNCGIGCW